VKELSGILFLESSTRLLSTQAAGDGGLDRHGFPKDEREVLIHHREQIEN
jgi:hypothetical protein